MQRNRQHRPRLFAERVNLRHNAGGGDRDAALRQRQTIAIRNHINRVANMIEVVVRRDPGSYTLLGVYKRQEHHWQHRQKTVGQVLLPVDSGHGLCPALSGNLPQRSDACPRLHARRPRRCELAG